MAALDGSIQVAIVTTRSVVAIQRVEPEMHSARSVMCINRTSVETGVSRAYNQFVSRGTGVVSKMTGIPAFRLDVDGEVTDGRSFELPVFLAHRLRHERRLAANEPGGEAAALWIATGEVDADHRVKAVDGIAQKIQVLQNWIAGGHVVAPIRLLLPAANRRDAEPFASSLQQLKVEVQFLEQADQAFAPVTAEPSLPTPRRSSALSIGALVVLIAAAIGIGWTVWTPAGPSGTPGRPNEAPADGSSTLSAATASSSSLDVLVRDIHSPDGGCYGGERRNGEHRAANGEIRLTDAGRYCRIEVSATRDGEPLRAYLVARNGIRLPPLDLGDRGSLVSKLTTDQSLLEVAFAPRAVEPPADVSQLPRVVIRVEPVAAR